MGIVYSVARYRGAIALMLAAILVVGGPARGEDATLASYFDVWSAPRAQINLRQQAACAVRKYPADARRVVVEDLTMQAIVNGMADLTKPCSAGALFKDNRFTMSQPVFEYFLAEALIARLPAGTPLDPVTSAPPLPRQMVPRQDFSALPDNLRRSIEITDQITRLDLATECAVRRDRRKRGP